jgi:hypothetical protein
VPSAGMGLSLLYEFHPSNHSRRSHRKRKSCRTCIGASCALMVSSACCISPRELPHPSPEMSSYSSLSFSCSAQAEADKAQALVVMRGLPAAMHMARR